MASGQRGEGAKLVVSATPAHLVGKRSDVGVVRDRELREGTVVADLELVLASVEGHRSIAQLVLVLAVEVGHATDGDVGLLALEHLGGLRERRATLPLPHAPRVARIRHLLFTKGAANEERVAVLVRQLRLRLRQLEAAIGHAHKLLLIEIKLSRDLGVGAAARERDHHAVLAHVWALV